MLQILDITGKLTEDDREIIRCAFVSVQTHFLGEVGFGDRDYIVNYFPDLKSEGVQKESCAYIDLDTLNIFISHKAVDRPKNERKNILFLYAVHEFVHLAQILRGDKVIPTDNIPRKEYKMLPQEWDANILAARLCMKFYSYNNLTYSMWDSHKITVVRYAEHFKPYCETIRELRKIRNEG